MTSFENKLVPHDIGISHDVLRFLFDERPLQTREYLEKLLARISENPTRSFFHLLTAASDAPGLDFGDFCLGIVAGVALAQASNQTDRGNVREFVAHYKKQTQGGNVSPITEAFRKREV